jgi:tetratricopeptide (TPR) repeat protein
MNANLFHTVVRPRIAAFLLGMSVLAAGGIATTVPADAAVRSVVGKPLQEAQSMAAAGNTAGAMAKIHQAESVGGLTAEESRVIAQMKAYISGKSSATGGKGKLSADYRAERWGAVIADGEAMRGQLDETDKAAIATAYYRSGNYAGCVRYIRGQFGNGASELVLKIQMACGFSANDDEAQTGALEQLVSRTQSAEYWGQLLKASEHTRGLNDHQTLDIYRLKLLTNTITGPDYTMLAKLCIEFGLAQEANSVLQKGIDSKVLNDPSTPRLQNMAKSQAGANAAGLGGKLAAAKAAPNGDALIKLGEDLVGQGKAKDAIDLIQQGIKKDKVDADNAQIRLGQAYLANGQKDAALKAFAQVKDTPNAKTIAHLWTLYARK